MTVRTQQSLGIRLAIFCWAGAIAFSLDQLTKRWILSNIPAGSRRPFIPGVLDLFHVQNDGAAFSIGSGRPLFFAALTAVVVLGMVYAVMREKNLPYPLIAILGLVAGGGIGNGLERVAHGSVTDFLATTFMNFAIFNVADIFVTCGIIAACIYWFVWDSKSVLAKMTVKPARKKVEPTKKTMRTARRTARRTAK